MEQRISGSARKALGTAQGSQARQPANAPQAGRIADVQVGMCTHRGPIRDLNEDLAGYRVPAGNGDEAARGAVFVVADGMGGHQAGEVASRTAVETVIHEYYADTEPHPGERLVRAAKVANRAIYEHALLDPARTGMGTTLVAAAILGSRVYVVNVGDSRAYMHIQAGTTGTPELKQITVDHSWVAEQVEIGLLTREQMAGHPQRNLITRALGTQPSVVVDLFKGDLVPGDTLLLCSDGVCGALPEATLAQILAALAPHDAARELVAQAALHGGEDNATALVVHALAVPPSSPSPAAGGPRKSAHQAEAAGAHAVDAGKPGDRPAVPGLDGTLARVQERARGLLAAALPAVEQWATRLGLPAFGGAAAGSKAIWATAAAALLVLACLCVLAVVTTILGQRDASAVAPEIAPIAASELGKAPDELATYLGYASAEEMQTRHAGQTAPGRWPAEKFVRLVGKASDLECDSVEECTFHLKVADRRYTIQCGHLAADLELNGEQVRVLAKVIDPQSHSLAAALAEWDDDQAKDGHNWRRFVGTLPDKQRIWVYGMVDDLVGPVAQSGSSASDVETRVLILGTWLENDSSLLQVEDRYVYQPDGTYKQVSGAHDRTPPTAPPATATLAPTKGPDS